MNLPELLKIAEAASEQAKTPQDQIKRSFTYGSSFTPDVAIELIKRLQEAEKRLQWVIENRNMRVQGNAEKGYCVLDCSNGLTFIVRHADTYKEAIDAAMNGGKE